MNITKSYEFFQPEKINGRVHIIGCGSVGSTIAENLVRCGVTKITLHDFDTVEAKNIANQMFRDSDIGKSKVEALAGILTEINPDIEDKLVLEPKGWTGKLLSGYVFLAVDSIEIRREFVEKHMDSPFIQAVYDCRTLLTGAQMFAADWTDNAMKQNLLKSMQFSHEEAVEATPVSACGVTLGVATTVRIIAALAANNFIKFVKGEGIWKFVEFDGFLGTLDCF